ncbi:MAG TPA: preprotein translocase subunit SecA, partial [Acholeplasmataceae bacterium]|nr:preprotein translocase subunit SecA [Acholeplasmataceae bacterium]
LLTKARVPHNVLNAKQPEREAEIVAHAGNKGSVTIATNMAGRGTDIKLGPGVVELGGLAVIGTERHESRRIDNQLRGRAGRQGDPGYSRFYLSAEDDLLKRFGSERFETMLNYVTQNREGGDEIPLESKMFSRFVENAQKKIEGNNFDARKTVLEYDEVLRVQREIIYEEREQVLFLDDVSEIIDKNIVDVARDLVNAASSDRKNKEIDHLKLHKDINGIYFPRDLISKEDLKGLLPEEAKELLIEKSYQGLKEKQEQFPEHIYKEFLKVILLRVIDTYWMDHIDAMSELRDTVRLQAYAQIDPLRQYRQIGFEKFEDLIYKIEHETVKFINRAQIRQNLEREEVIKPVSASSGKEDTEVKRKPVVNKKGKVSRNDPCPCGSGKKYKNCCGR